MEAARGVEKTLALRLLEEGHEQEILVDKEAILGSVMTFLEAETMPKFSEIDCGDGWIQMEVHLPIDLEGKGKPLIVAGKPLRSKESAKDDSILMALNQLQEQFVVKVIDYSSRVAETFLACNTGTCVNEAIDSVKRVINTFQSVMTKVMDLGKRFQEEMKQEQSGGRHENAKILGSLRRFLGSLVRKFANRVIESKEKLSGLELQKMKHDEEMMDKWVLDDKKGEYKVVLMSNKELLDYVLSIFGSNRATYANGPGDGDKVEGTVMFSIPYIKGLKFSGNIRMNGTGGNTIESEEDAAFQAMLMMESEWKVQIVGLNHSSRVCAEKLQVMLADLLGEVLKVGNALKDVWDEFVQTIGEHGEHFNYELDFLLSTGKKDRAAFYHSCNSELTKLEKESAKIGYNICLELFDNLEMLSHELHIIKIKLGIM